MSPRTGRPTKGDTPRTKKIGIRASEEELSKIEYCADKLNVSRTDAIMRGIDLLIEKLKKK